MRCSRRSTAALVVLVSLADRRLPLRGAVRERSVERPGAWPCVNVTGERHKSRELTLALDGHTPCFVGAMMTLILE